MANKKGNESSLVKYQPKWKSGKIKTIRVPIAIADRVLEVAKEIDDSGASNTVTSDKTYDRTTALAVFEELFSASSNKGGQIELAAAKLGELFGFEINREKGNWSITDTSDLID